MSSDFLDSNFRAFDFEGKNQHKIMLKKKKQLKTEFNVQV